MNDIQKKYIEYVDRFQEGNKYGLDFIDNYLDKEVDLTQNDIEHILDFLYDKKKIYTKIGVKTILEKANKWSEDLQKQATIDNEVEGVDYEVIKDFGDGFKFVKLISENCYKREGKLMGHCVASYFGRDVKIYSLRDKNNNPHCTVEENNQVKGKGGQAVGNKYFGYCMQFLEEMGYKVSDNEMKNIGYHKLDTIDKNLTCDKLWDNKYVCINDLDRVKDKYGNTYKGLGLLNVKKLVEVRSDYSTKFNFNIDELVAYTNECIALETK